MSDRINIVEEYRTLMAAVLTEAMTDDERVVWISLLAEMRAGYAAGMWGTDEEKGAGVEQAPVKVRLAWVRDGAWDCIVPHDHRDGTAALCAVYDNMAKHYPGGICTADRHGVFADRVTALRAAAEWARADGYEVPDHPGAAPATTDAPTLPPSR